ncbi:hypothetical protein [Streptomyces sp. NPDC005827]|uniref:hypothetical protein n=1 Tax=Streptomyces sp. NPDC005827 TaxID=3157070 RepID=UPI0033CCE0DF
MGGISVGDEGLQYFASADGAIDYKIASGEFETSLIYNVLFGGSALVMPDIFFFNCNPLLNHLKFSPGQVPFFLAALKGGLVVPAFRTADIETFRQSLEQVGLMKVRGAEADRFDLQAIAAKLDENLPREMRPARWRDNLGGCFEQLMDRVFLESGQGINDDATRSMWTEIEEWRVVGLAGAKELTREQGGSGLRRAEIWNAIGHHLELISPSEAYHKPIDFIEDVTRNLGPEAGVKASFLIDVVNLCYQQNQASGLLRANRSSEPNIPRTLSHAGRAIIKEIDPSGPWHTPGRVFQCTVKVPKVRTLLNADSKELLAVRDGTKGASYRHFRDSWVKHPSDDNAEQLRIAIDKYAKEIRSKAVGAQEKTKIVMVRNTATIGIAGGVGAAIKQLAPLLEAHPGYVLVGALAGAGAAAGAIVKNVSAPTNKKYRLEIPSFDAEYNLGSGSDPGDG